MRKSIVLSMAVALLLLAGTSTICSSAQDTANDQTPTFYRWTPGTYVNGWPRFTITYPKDWVERRCAGGGLFCASLPGSVRMEGSAVYFVSEPTPLPLDKYADWMVAYFKKTATTDVTLVSDKPSRLRDGTPARELEFKLIMNGLPWNILLLASRKGDILLSSNVSTRKGAIGEDLRAIAYSFQYLPGKDNPIKVPPDVQEFLDGWCNDLVAHDLAKVMSRYSDRYRDSGFKKRDIEEFFSQVIAGTTSQEVGVTDFVPEGNKTHLAGFTIVNKTIRFPLGGSSGGTAAIIKENGEWKWYGNQRDPAP
jgi:hypothetical protein